VLIMDEVDQYDRRHGGPFDRGSADAYYGRRFRPHYYTGRTYQSPAVLRDQMTQSEVDAYRAGYEYAVSTGQEKDWI